MPKTAPTRAELSAPRPRNLRAGEPGLAHFIKRIGASLRAYRRWGWEPWLRHAAIQELRRLDDRDLRDVGIERYEIDAMVDDMLAKRRQDK